MNLIKPKNIKPGDTIAIIAPSGEVEKSLIDNACEYFKARGYNVKYGKNLFNKNNYLAGNDIERLEDLHWAFVDNTVDGIICARGGYGAIRLINSIDYNIIKSNPKIFCGYSDITALSAMMLKNCGLITYSGAMAQSDFSSDINEYTQNSFWNALECGHEDIDLNKLKIYKNGLVDGISLVGNLATFASLAGVDFIPDEKFVFVIEDINEQVYKIDKYIHQLLNIPKFRKNLSAILLGDFMGIDNNVYSDNLWNELAQKLDIPIAGGIAISHSDRKQTLPFGTKLHIEIF